MPTLQEFAIKWELSEDCGKYFAVVYVPNRYPNQVCAHFSKKS